ncbi:MAG: glutathione S-transferase N-terminal domain-containing protein [Myxococcota bacterium]
MPIRNTLRRLFGADTAPPPAPVKTPTPNTDAADDAPVKGAHTLALYKYDSCPYCRRVLRAIDQLGVADQIEFRDTLMEPKWRQDLRDKTGRTQVPCLFIDGEPLFESADIIDWLNEQYG